jgi:hypothetical protein
MTTLPLGKGMAQKLWSDKKTPGCGKQHVIRWKPMHFYAF